MGKFKYLHMSQLLYLVLDVHSTEGNTHCPRRNNTQCLNCKLQLLKTIGGVTFIRKENFMIYAKMSNFMTQN